jgi:hypothetical protein
MQAACEGSHPVELASDVVPATGPRSADPAPQMAVTPANGMQASALEANWFKSSFSGPNGDCVEAAELPDGIAVRNSRFPDGPALLFTESEWDAFLRGVKGGDFG